VVFVCAVFLCCKQKLEMLTKIVDKDKGAYAPLIILLIHAVMLSTGSSSRYALECFVPKPGPKGFTGLGAESLLGVLYCLVEREIQTHFVKMKIRFPDYFSALNCLF
jgi:hypothetical protein